MNQNKLSAYSPLLFALMLAAGIFIGFNLSDSRPLDLDLIATDKKNKLGQVITLIDQRYVDTVDTDDLVEETIDEILYDLDPHSDYIPASELDGATEPLSGEFEGIGVEFTIQRDTLIVINPVEGGPSEKVGIKPGDRIILVDDSLIAGVGVENQTVMDLLKGESGTKVEVKIHRKGGPELLPFTIKRDRIPIKSVAVALRINEETGYLKLLRFASTTRSEFRDAMNKIKVLELKNLVLDLRDNGGGYLQTAVELADEFLPANKLIVYTKGKSYDNKEYRASESGKLDKINLYILINENSASASEVLAGAIQDNDRGTIIGRRSFGKGLVQDQLFFDDHSALRLTIARYFTPTGRSIQKPYGDGIDYENDYLERFENGELLNSDSISFPDSLKFTTPQGKTVYGGGGIMPDLFVGIDTMGASEYLSEIGFRGLINRFGFQFADDHREELNKFANFNEFINGFEVDEKILNDFIAFAESNDVETDQDGLKASKTIIRDRLKAYIARNIWKNDAFYSVLLTDDKIFKATLKFIGEAEN
ncbi:MAG: S41 family peptidase [Flavobacteriales bacterium]|nr:S41 family peptidase [Flavobacteriales bacterium]